MLNMRIDSHQHFWKYNSHDYVWMTELMDVLRRDYLPDELQRLIQQLGFDGTITVQARQMTSETDWLLELARRHSMIYGVVGWVDFESPLLDEHLERYASNSKFKGVRELIHDMPDVNYSTSTAHVRGISKLARFALTYDLLLKPQHIRSAIELVRQFPDQSFVVDHIAKPEIAARIRSPWQEDIKTLARFGNVCCKLSGMVTEATWNAWLPSDFYPYLDTVLEAFGPNRLMIGSDWPVCALSGDYEDVMGIVIEYAEKLSPEEQLEILGGTCARFYSVEEAVIKI